MPISFDEWKKSQDKRSSVGSAITGAVGGKPGGQSGGGSVSGSIVGAVQQQPTGQSGQSGGTMSFAEWQQQQEQSSGGSSGTVGGSILGGLGVQGGSQQPVTQGDLAAGQKLYEQRKQAQANADPWTPTFKWLGGIAQQAEQARNGLQVDPTETYSAWEDVKDAWEASRKANRAADYAGRDKLIKEYIAARHEMGAQRHTPEPEVQRRYEQARDRLYEQERIHGNIGLNANGELQTMSYSAGERVGNVIGGVIGRTIGHVGSAATWLGEAAARSEYAKSAAHQRELAAFYAMTGNDNASEGASRMADTLTQRAAQRENLAEFGGAYSFFDKQGRAGNRLVQAAKENQRPVVQMGVDVGSTALEMGFDAVSGSPLVSMGVRVFGGSSQEAREAGASFLQQGAYGAASASIEVMTETIGGLKLYGGGQLDEVLEPALREIAGTPGGYALLRAMYTMAQEGNEEVLSDLLQPLAQSIYNGQSVGENYSELQLKDILYDWLLGAASAFGGAVVESGGYAQDYTAMREMQQDLNAQGVETGRMTDEQLRQAYTLDKAGVNVAGLQSAENRAAGGETIGEAYDNMTQEQREAALVNMLTAQTQRSGQTQTPTDNITRETAQEILRESLGEREAESAERILDLGSESNLREQAIAYHTIATEYGQTEGRSVEDALRSNVRGALNDTQVQHAYAYGESLRKSGQTVGVNGQVTEQSAQTAKPVRRAGLVTAGTFADGNTTYKAADLSKADARDLRILNDIAKAQGVDFVLYESELGEADAEGRRSYIGANGAYRNGVVYLDINAGLSGERTENGKTYSIGQRALLVTAAHELTHHLEHSNAAMYRQLRSFVTERLGGSDSFISYVREAMAREDISVEAASREVVARACEEVLLDEDAIRELQGKKPTLWEQIKEWVKDFVKKFQSPSGEAVEMRQYADELRRLWLGAAKEVQESAGGTADVVFAEGAAKQTGSGADISHSLRENNNITARTMAYLGKHPAAHISAEMIETANGIINEMTDYMLPYLDKDNNLGRHYLPEEVLGTTIFSDSSYGKSVENTTICFRTLAYIDFTNEIKKRIGRPLTVQESFLASQMLYDIAKEPQCLYCYVSLDRKAYDEFLGKYLEQRDGVLKAFGELSSEEQTKIVEALRGIAPEEKGAAAVYARIPLYAEFLKDESGKKRKNTAPMRQRFGLWISAAAGGKGFITAKDLTTAETRNALKEGELAEQVLDAERYAQAASWAKKLEEYRAYNGNILNMSQETVDKLNESYGLRFYSFSEYSAAFIVENMQQIRDAAAKGLYGLAYTKKPDFARIFAGTGININISTFGRWGVDAQGKRVVVMDDLQGANWDEVKQLRDDFKNVGAVFVATDDAMVDWALAQDWIDVVIPFHIVRTGADVANFYKWVVHNQDQADKTKKGKAKDITPPEHQNDRATFLALAKERGLTPRFSKWLGNEHYMKLVNETRQPTKNSTPLKPVFDLKAAKQSFDDFVDEGGYYGNWYKEKTEQTGPVAYSYEEAVDQVVSDVKAGRKANEVSYGRQDIDVVAENFGKARQNAPRAHGQAMGPTVQRSVRDREYSEAVARGDMETDSEQFKRWFKGSKIVDEDGNPLVVYHGTDAEFTAFDMSKGRANMDIQGAFFSPWEIDAAGYGSNVGAYYLSIKNPAPEGIAYKALNRFKGQNNAGVKARKYLEALGYDGVNNGGEEYIAFYPEQIKSATDNIGTFDSNNPDTRYSQREADAMTDREILMLADAYGEGQTELAEFRDAMARYQDYDEAAQEHLQKLGELQQERKAVTDMRTSMGEITPQEKQQRLSALDEQIATERREATKAEQNASRALDRVTQLEKGRALQDILVKERAAQRQRTRAQVNERTRRRDTRRKVEKLAKELQKRVVTPSEKRYIPKDLMRQTVDVLQAINLDSGKPGTRSGEALRARLLELQDRYRQLETDETYKGASYDPTVAEMLKNMVQTVGDTPINKMTAAQLESVYNTLRAMTHVIQTGIKVKIAGEEREAWEVAHDMTRETRSVNKPKDGRLSGWTNSQLSAERMFRRLGNYTKNSAWEKVYRMLNDGQLKMTLIQMEGAQIFADLIGKENEKAYRELNSYKDKDLVDVGLTDVDGNSIKISHGMMVSLYMHLINEQNARHVARGGLTIPDLKGYYTGADDRGFGSGERRAVGISAELAEARREQADAEDELREAKQSGDAEAIQQAENAVDSAKANVDKILAKGDAYLASLRESIEKQLTDYERDWIAATQELMDGYSKDRLNETTLEVYGIKKARVENYYPIKSDRNFTRGDFEAVSRNMSLENVGFMKERVEGTNPMYLMDVADVVNTQISNVAQYCGLMPAIRSFNKIWNKSEAGNTVSLKDTVNQKFGQGGLKYVENLIADLQGARRSKSDSLSRFLSGMRGNMAGANLTISLNTALAQAASYPTAASEIGWTPLIKAFFKGGQSGRMISRADRELIAKYTPLLWTRLQGYSTVELGDLAGNNQLAGRVFRKMRFITGWIQAMDTATVGRLWYAAQYYVDAKNPELQKGSDAYYKETAKVFNDIVEKTQPDYTTMQRPDILRHPNELVRSLTMFMTQRLQNFNIVYDAVATAQKYRQDYRNGQANGVTAEDVKQAQHEARRAVVSQIAAGATIVVFKTLSGILQHALDGYRDDDKELTEESISLACLDMFLDTMASNFLWGGELYDVIESAITGNRYYGLEVNGVQSISDILSTSQSLFSMLRDYKTLSLDKVQPKFITLAKKLGPALGLPIGNAVKLCKGIWLWGQEVIHAAEDSDMLKAFDFEEGVERGADIEANRYVSAWLDRDREKMREIIGGLGVSMTSFNSQLSSEIRERYEEGSINRAQAIRMLQELRGKTPEQAEKTVSEWKFKVDTGIDYDDIKEQLLNGSISVQRAAAYWQKYGGMSAEDATLKANYVAACGATPGLADKLSQTQYKGWYNNVRSAGVKVDVYAEIRSTASTDGNSNVSQAEAAAAITRAINARQLTPAQAQAVWQSFSSSWKTTYAEYIAQNK